MGPLQRCLSCYPVRFRGTLPDMERAPYLRLPKSVVIRLLCFAVPCLFTPLFLSACSDPKKEVPLLIEQLRSPESHTRSQAALRLGRIGPPHANRAQRDLIRLLNDPNPGVQSAAAYALTSIGTKEAMAAYNRHKNQ